MNKRESGWYRVWNSACEGVMLMEWDAAINEWCVYDANKDEHLYQDGVVTCIDPQMVMTPSGQIVYNQPAEPTERAKAAVERYNNPNSWNVNEHDPLYNTKQEG
ncbi:MAG: hypothetical protein ACRCVE_01855 [Plesiomonas sp.]